MGFCSLDNLKLNLFKDLVFIDGFSKKLSSFYFSVKKCYNLKFYMGICSLFKDLI